VDVATASLFFALLSLLALAGGLAGWISLAFRSGPVARLRTDLAPLALPLAFVVAAVATLGSLYYSEVAHFTPCRLCWYQRIAMYPLAVVLGIATFRRDLGVRRYVLPLALIGLAVSVYHVQLQLFPDQATACDVEAPCTTKEVEELGFVTIPFMAGAGFVAISGLLAAARTPAEEDD
jgi:disulfide bond formation protein DsbB